MTCTIHQYLRIGTRPSLGNSFPEAESLIPGSMATACLPTPARRGPLLRTRTPKSAPSSENTAHQYYDPNEITERHDHMYGYPEMKPDTINDSGTFEGIRLPMPRSRRVHTTTSSRCHDGPDGKMPPGTLHCLGARVLLVITAASGLPHGFRHCRSSCAGAKAHVQVGIACVCM